MQPLAEILIMFFYQLNLLLTVDWLYYQIAHGYTSAITFNSRWSMQIMRRIVDAKLPGPLADNAADMWLTQCLMLDESAIFKISNSVIKNIHTDLSKQCYWQKTACCLSSQYVLNSQVFSSGFSFGTPHTRHKCKWIILKGCSRLCLLRAIYHKHLDVSYWVAVSSSHWSSLNAWFAWLLSLSECVRMRGALLIFCHNTPACVIPASLFQDYISAT